MSKRIMLDVRGRLRVKDQQGQPVDIVIQLAGKGFGNGRIVGNRQYLIRRHVPNQNNPRTPKQVANREKFKAAVAAWKDLTEDQRREFHEQAREQGQTGWNRWLSERLAMAD